MNLTIRRVRYNMKEEVPHSFSVFCDGKAESEKCLLPTGAPLSGQHECSDAGVERLVVV